MRKTQRKVPFSGNCFYCRRHCPESKNQEGFTLVELMVAVAIMLIIGAIAAPNFLTTSPRYHLKKSARDLASNIRKARSLAIKFNRDVSIVFDTGNKRYIVDGGIPVDLDNTVSFGDGAATSVAVGADALPGDGISFDDNTITFNSRGFCTSTGAVYLENTKNDAYAVVTTTAGNISMKQWGGSSWK